MKKLKVQKPQGAKGTVLENSEVQEMSKVSNEINEEIQDTLSAVSDEEDKQNFQEQWNELRTSVQELQKMFSDARPSIDAVVERNHKYLKIAKNLTSDVGKLAMYVGLGATIVGLAVGGGGAAAAIGAGAALVRGVSGAITSSSLLANRVAAARMDYLSGRNAEFYRDIALSVLSAGGLVMSAGRLGDKYSNFQNALNADEAANAAQDVAQEAVNVSTDESIEPTDINPEDAAKLEDAGVQMDSLNAPGVREEVAESVGKTPDEIVNTFKVETEQGEATVAIAADGQGFAVTEDGQVEELGNLKQEGADAIETEIEAADQGEPPLQAEAAEAEIPETEEDRIVQELGTDRDETAERLEQEYEAAKAELLEKYGSKQDPGYVSEWSQLQQKYYDDLNAANQLELDGKGELLNQYGAYDADGFDYDKFNISRPEENGVEPTEFDSPEEAEELASVLEPSEEAPEVDEPLETEPEVEQATGETTQEVAAGVNPNKPTYEETDPNEKLFFDAGRNGHNDVFVRDAKVLDKLGELNGDTGIENSLGQSLGEGQIEVLKEFPNVNPNAVPPAFTDFSNPDISIEDKSQALKQSVEYLRPYMNDPRYQEYANAMYQKVIDEAGKNGFGIEHVGFNDGKFEHPIELDMNDPFDTLDNYKQLAIHFSDTKPTPDLNSFTPPEDAPEVDDFVGDTLQNAQGNVAQAGTDSVADHMQNMQSPDVAEAPEAPSAGIQTDTLAEQPEVAEAPAQPVAPDETSPTTQTSEAAVEGTQPQQTADGVVQGAAESPFHVDHSKLNPISQDYISNYLGQNDPQVDDLAQQYGVDISGDMPVDTTFDKGNNYYVYKQLALNKLNFRDTIGKVKAMKNQLPRDEYEDLFDKYANYYKKIDSIMVASARENGINIDTTYNPWDKMAESEKTLFDAALNGTLKKGPKGFYVNSL